MRSPAKKGARHLERRRAARRFKWLSLPRATPLPASATIGARPKVANFSVAVAEAARQLSTDDLVVLLQQQGTASELGMECENQRCYITGAGRTEGGDDGHAVPAGPVGEPGCDDCQVTCLVGHITARK